MDFSSISYHLITLLLAAVMRNLTAAEEGIGIFFN